MTANGWAAFQRRVGLTPDGIPGPRTLAAVEELEAQLHGKAAIIEGAYTYGGGELRQGVDRDPRKLLPGFAARVEVLFRRLRDMGHDPLLWEGHRSLARAEKLARKGTGIARSMHCYGAAVDIVDGSDSTPWTDVPEGFWEALGREAEGLGLVVLYRNGRRRDFPHVQAIPVGEQNSFRALTAEQRVLRVA